MIRRKLYILLCAFAIDVNTAIQNIRANSIALRGLIGVQIDGQCIPYCIRLIGRNGHPGGNGCRRCVQGQAAGFGVQYQHLLVYIACGQGQFLSHRLLRRLTVF